MKVRFMVRRYHQWALSDSDPGIQENQSLGERIEKTLDHASIPARSRD